jgi:hypothetical protein
LNEKRLAEGFSGVGDTRPPGFAEESEFSHPSICGKNFHAITAAITNQTRVFNVSSLIKKSKLTFSEL